MLSLSTPVKYCLLTCMELLRGLQDYEIECPQTGTLFSLKTGEITSWCCPMPCSITNCACHELFDSAKLLAHWLVLRQICFCGSLRARAGL